MSGRAFLIAAIVALMAVATATFAVGSSFAGASKPKVYPTREGSPSVDQARL